MTRKTHKKGVDNRQMTDNSIVVDKGTEPGSSSNGWPVGDVRDANLNALR